jgi:septal ring factor EnvC (AmiA/AmiB activator)
MREQREGAMRAVITTAILSGGIVALLLVLFYRNKLKSARELAELNARLDKQWKDLCKTNEELSRVNKEMADALERLAKR